MRPEVAHDITMNEENVRVIFRIPTFIGWIEFVTFYYWEGSELREVNLECWLEQSNEEYAIFKGEIDWVDSHFSHYFFKYKVGDKILFDRHIREMKRWQPEDWEILKTYQNVVKYHQNGCGLTMQYRIISISREHLMVERKVNQTKILVIINRTSQKIRIPIPREYTYSQVVFCAGGIDGNVFQPNSAVVLKDKENLIEGPME